MTAGVIEIIMAGIGPSGAGFGVVGGDLQGSLPNPTIKTGVIDTAKLANLAVTDAKIASVTMAKVTGLDAALAARATQVSLDAEVARATNAEQSLDGRLDSIEVLGPLATDAELATAVSNVNAVIAGKAEDNLVVKLAGVQTVTGAKTFTSVVMAQQDVEITDATKGLVGKSPNGTRWRLVFGDDGLVETAAMA